MADYSKVSVDWLIRMFADGYIALCDADKHEILDVVFED